MWSSSSPPSDTYRTNSLASMRGWEDYFLISPLLKRLGLNDLMPFWLWYLLWWLRWRFWYGRIIVISSTLPPAFVSDGPIYIHRRWRRFLFWYWDYLIRLLHAFFAVDADVIFLPLIFSRRISAHFFFNAFFTLMGLYYVFDFHISYAYLYENVDKIVDISPLSLCQPLSL